MRDFYTTVCIGIDNFRLYHGHRPCVMCLSPHGKKLFISYLLDLLSPHSKPYNLLNIVGLLKSINQEELITYLGMTIKFKKNFDENKYGFLLS